MKTSAKVVNLAYATFLCVIATLGFLYGGLFGGIIIIALFFLPVLPIGYARWRWWYRRKEPFWESWYKMVPYRPDHVIARDIELGSYMSGKPIRKELYIPIRNKIDSSCRLCGAYMPKGTRIYWAPSLRMALCQKCFERDKSEIT